MKKLRIILGILIVLIMAFLFLNYGGFYYSPEDAVKFTERPDENMKPKFVISTIWIDDIPMSFYISKNNNLFTVTFIRKIINNKTAWRIGSDMYLKGDFNNKRSVNWLTDKLILNSQNDESVKRVLYGISKAEDRNINYVGKDEEIKKVYFEYQEEQYILWYLVGGSELDKYFTN